MIRVYDTNALWRHDEILRIRHLEAEIDASRKEMVPLKKEYAASEERIRKLKNEIGFID